MSAIPDDIMQTATEIVDRVPLHTWKGDCVADVAQALQAERQRTDDLIEEVKRVLVRIEGASINYPDRFLIIGDPMSGEILADVSALLSKLGERT